jgi:tetratricopeptide (TPR) repeat protein
MVDYSKADELTSSVEIRIAIATYLIDFQRPAEGADMLDALVKATQSPSGDLLLEAARANLLVGRHQVGAALLDQADKVPNLTRWKYERERGRLAFRKASFSDAGTAFESALDKCGDDVETFYLAAEVAVADDKKPNTKLIEKLKQLAPQRLKDRPERKIVEAKLLGSKGDEANKLYSDAKAMIGEAASPRRRSQAALGLGIVAYNKDDDPTALITLDLAFDLDPTIYEAYLYYADIKKNKDAGKDRDAELKSALAKAQKAIELNPDFVDGYVMVGQVAYKLGNRKLLAEMLTKVNALAPNSDQLKALQALR